MKFYKIIVFLLVTLFMLTSCSTLDDDSNSASKLIIASVTGNDISGSSGSTTIYSDVLTSGSVVNDVAEVTAEAYLKDVAALSNTVNNTVIIDQVDVVFTRSDMSNAVQGKDVPYGYSEALNVSVPIEKSVAFSITIMRHSAKLESPLVNLVNLGSDKILKLEAHLTFHSRDVAGKRLSPVTATVSIWCSNFADAESDS